MSVYTTIEKNELEAFLAHYSVGNLSDYQGISAGIENTNYFVNTNDQAEQQRFVLTIFEHHSFEEMQYYLNLMHHLADHGVPSADPVADNAGDYLRQLKDKPAALVKRLNGSSIDNTSLAHCEQIGAALGKLHSAGMRFQAHQANPRGTSWFKRTTDKVMSTLPDAEQQLLSDEVAYQMQHKDADIPRGVIHADLFRDNALWHGDTLSGIIDFYYACDDALLYDVAITVNDWCLSDDFSLHKDKTIALLTAYNQQRHFEQHEHKYWPTMLRAAALRFWLSRLQDKHFPRPGELVTTKDPDEFKVIIADRINQQDTYQHYWV